MSDDPVRLDLSGDVPPDALEALRLARADAPDATRLAAIEKSVLAQLPPGGGGGGGSGGALKMGAAAAGIGAVVVAVVLASRSTPAPPAPAAVDATPPVAAIAPTVAVSSEPATLSVNDLPSASAPPAPSAPPPDPAEEERAEVALLDRAQASLASSPTDTLARCDEHARRFAKGTLVQEREVLAIDALLRLGRRPEAEARAARFEHAFPRSAQLRRVEALLAH